MAGTRRNLTSVRRTFAENAPKELTPAVAPRLGRLRFGRFVLLADEGRLLRDDQPIPLAPKPFETLVYLVSHPGRLVSKQELLDAVWPGTFITEDGLVQCVVEIRRALGDSARSPRFVETVPKRGYRFLVPVEGEDGPPDRVAPVAPARPGPGAQAPGPLASLPPSLSSPRRRTWLWGPVAFVLVLGAGAAVWRLPRSEPSTTAPRAAPQPGTVLVLPMQMVDGLDDLAWLRTGLIDLVGAQLGGEAGVRLAPRHAVDAAVRAAGVKDALVLSRERALEIARAVGAERLVTGSVQRVDGRFVLRASVLGVGSARIEREVAVHGDRRADLLDVLGQFSRQIGEALGAGPSAPRDFAPGPLATRSVAAYRAYTEALELEAAGGRDEWAEAEARLTRAVQEDRSFARAYVRLAVIQQTRRRWGYGTADPRPAVRSAMRLSSRLPERERLLVSGLAALLLRGDFPGALAEWTTLMRVHPAFAQESGVPRLVADALMNQGQWARAIMEGEPHVEAPAMPRAERALLHSLLAKAFRKQGEIERALDHGMRALELWPAREGPALLRLRTLVGRLMVDASRRGPAIEAFRQVAASPHADVVNLTDAAWGFYMAGERDEAARLVERALGIDPQYGNAYHLRGWLALTGGQPAAAAADLRRAYERTPAGFGAPDLGMVRGDTAALYYAGVAHARAGEADRAAAAWREVLQACRAAAAAPPSPDFGRETMRWHATHCAAMAGARLGVNAPAPGRLEGDDPTYYLMMARLFAVQGRPEEALDALRQAVSLGAGDRQHTADDPNFDSLAGDARFRGLLAVPR